MANIGVTESGETGLYGHSQDIHRRNLQRQDSLRKGGNLNAEDETELEASTPPDTPPRIRQKALQSALAEAAPRVRRGNFAFAEPAPPLPEADVEWSAVREIVEALKKKPNGREVVWRLEQELEWGHHNLAEFIFEHSEYFALETKGTVPLFNELCVAELKMIWQEQLTISPPVGSEWSSHMYDLTDAQPHTERIAVDYPMRINATDEHHRIAAWMDSKYGKDRPDDGMIRNKFGMAMDFPPTMDYPYPQPPVGRARDDDHEEDEDQDEEVQEAPWKRWRPTMNRYQEVPRNPTDLPSGVTFEYFSAPSQPVSGTAQSKALDELDEVEAEAEVKADIAVVDTSQEKDLWKRWSPRNLMLLDDEEMREPKRKRCQCEDCQNTPKFGQPYCEHCNHPGTWSCFCRCVGCLHEDPDWSRQMGRKTARAHPPWSCQEDVASYPTDGGGQVDDGVQWQFGGHDDDGSWK